MKNIRKIKADLDEREYHQVRVNQDNCFNEIFPILRKYLNTNKLNHQQLVEVLNDVINDIGEL